MARTMTVRFEEPLWQEVETVARLSGTSASDVVRAAIAQFIESQGREPDFREAVRRRNEENLNRMSRFKPS